MLLTVPYHWERAVAYARTWAYRRNPRYLDFSDIGGDCTNFVSQCLYAANSVMNFTPVYGWFYLSADNRTASWTGVQYLYDFLTGNQGTGPFASETGLEAARPGDVIQLGDAEYHFYHSVLVTDISDQAYDRDGIIVASHSNDALCRPLSTYLFANARVLHIEGVRAEQI